MYTHHFICWRNSVNVAGWVQLQSEMLSHREQNQSMLLQCDEIITSEFHHYPPPPKEPDLSDWIACHSFLLLCLV